MSRLLGRWLRRLADRIDYAGAPKYASPYSFTFEERRGIVFRDDGRGCPLVYLSDAERQRAYDESDAARRPRYNDMSPEERDRRLAAYRAKAR